jgi:branched-chain amino acid transport system substrate-binding protein
MPVALGAKAYFDYVNAHGGVNGRKIVYKIVDDGYDPTRTILATRQLVEQDHVLAIFNSVGTEHNIAIRDYLNQQKVPQLFVGTGASTFAKDAKKHPWSVPYLPSFVGEGTVYGRWIVKSRPKAKMAVLYEDTDYGHDLLNGLKKGLGRRAGQIAATQSYTTTDVDVSAQVARLKASGANTFLIFAVPKQAIQAFVSASRLGWHPQFVISSVSIDPFVMKVIALNAGPKAAEGAISSGWLRNPTDPAEARDTGVRLYRSIMKRFLPNDDPTALAHIYGMSAAYTMVDALKQAGRNPTRDSLLRAATHLNETNPFVQSGIRVRTTPSDYFPIGQTRLVVFRGGAWRIQPRLFTTG